MARRKSDDGTGEQMDLIDVSPENMKKIKPVARRYKAAQKVRIEALKKETELKAQLLSLIKDSNPTHLEDGSIKFQCDGMLITVTPRDELIKVKDEDGESEDE